MNTLHSRLAAIFALVILVLLIDACHKGPCLHSAGKKGIIVEQTGYFYTLNVEGVFRVILVQDTSNYIEFEGGENELEYTSFRNEESKLYITNANNCEFLRNHEKISCYVHFTGMEIINLFSVCKIESKDTITLNMGITVQNALAEIDILVNNDRLFFYNNSTTGGVYIFRGKSNICWLSCYYLGRLDASQLKSVSMYFKSYTIADCFVNAEKLLNVQLRDRGNIFYYGNPKIETDSMYGSGKLIRAAERTKE